MPKVVKRAPTSKAVPRSRLRFLNIPLEIREHVYTDLLDSAPSSLFDLLLTNRQIANEAKPFLYRQSIIFDGQGELVSWLRSIDRGCLRHVVDIQFKLHDIDPAKIVGALGKRLRQGSPDNDDNPYQESCEMEVERLGKYFQHLPNLRNFTILPYEDGDPRPPYDMLVSFADMLEDHFPNLRSLTNYEELFPITFLASFGKLQHLRFTGVSTSTRSEVFRTFRKLPELTKLEVWRPDANIEDNRYEKLSEVIGAGRCNIAEIIGALPQLRGFSYREFALSARPSAAFNPVRKSIFECLNALEKHPALRSLQILTNIDLLSRVQEKLESIISSSRSLRHLESYYDDMPAFEKLPKTTETLVMRLDPLSELTPGLLMDLLSGAKESRAQLPRLAEIALYIDSFPDSERAQRTAGWVRDKLREIGVRLRLKTWSGPSRF